MLIGFRQCLRTRSLQRLDVNQCGDHGFTLVELLVVMIIVGVLAAVAIPQLLSQRQKAHDVAAKADVAKLGKEIAAHFIGNNDMPSVAIVGNQYQVNGVNSGMVSPGITNLETAGTSSTDWCVSVTDAQGAVRNFKYSSMGGLQAGIC